MSRKISVAIPTYNQAQYLKEAVLSAYKQTFTPFEIIVYNDCSTDNTALVLSGLSEVVPQLKIVHQEENKGIAINKNACLRACSGDYIILLDSDDLLQPQYSEVLVKLLEKHPKAGYAHGNVQQIDEANHNTKLRLLYRKKEYQNATDELISLVSGMKVAANIILYRKEVLVKINYFNCPVNFCEDWYMLCQIADADYGNVFSKEILSSYRVWTDSGKIRQKRKLEEIKGYQAVFEKVLIPAFETRNWAITAINLAKCKKAVGQSKSLAFKYFTKVEKEEIKNGLIKLSDHFRVKFYIRCYMSKFAFLFLYRGALKARAKNFIKIIILKL